MRWKSPAWRAKRRATAGDIAGVVGVLAASAYAGYLIFNSFLSGHPAAMAGASFGMLTAALLGTSPFIARLETRDRIWHGREEAFAAETLRVGKKVPEVARLPALQGINRNQPNRMRTDLPKKARGGTYAEAGRA